ncbi:hypothetical protein M404DRAFT_30423 [Pisolithus tinctorius Marx 270]|uniref:Uncharacterized protein n=1 Tax=Pisolithus tinctorius Marx 270 TaxID=870435 RepID=A0A0C3JPZ1_PISTI|nr:hypothetical protein M404DRAFT_30423 [Pisolithus tinctorius Marx 270]
MQRKAIHFTAAQYTREVHAFTSRHRWSVSTRVLPLTKCFHWKEELGFPQRTMLLLLDHVVAAFLNGGREQS